MIFPAPAIRAGAAIPMARIKAKIETWLSLPLLFQGIPKSSKSIPAKIRDVYFPLSALIGTRRDILVFVLCKSNTIVPNTIVPNTIVPNTIVQRRSLHALW
jgi:hypothetical protein